MKIETKHVIQWTVTVAVGIVGIWATLRHNVAVNGGGTVDTNSPFSLGAPSISIIGGSDPSTWNIAATQPYDSNGTGTSTAPVNLPVITNYNTTGNSGCQSCANAPNLYYASAIEANAAITAEMLHLEGYTKVNGSILSPGYYNLTGT